MISLEHIYWILIGLVSGTVLSLTGAGGAIIAIPLFVWLLKMNLASATSAALLVLVAGALLSWFLQRKNTHYQTALSLVVFAAITIQLTTPYKSELNDVGIFILFLGVCSYSLYQLWKPQALQKQNLKAASFLETSSVGVLIGILTTFTGLGGGVFMVPWLKERKKLALHEATATSLFTVVLSSLGSTLLQFHKGYISVSPYEVGSLILGTVFSAFFVKLFFEKLPADKKDKIRKILFTFVVFVSITSLLRRVIL